MTSWVFFSNVLYTVDGPEETSTWKMILERLLIFFSSLNGILFDDDSKGARCLSYEVHDHIMRNTEMKEKSIHSKQLPIRWFLNGIINGDFVRSKCGRCEWIWVDTCVIQSELKKDLENVTHARQSSITLQKHSFFGIQNRFNSSFRPSIVYVIYQFKKKKTPKKSDCHFAKKRCFRFST